MISITYFARTCRVLTACSVADDGKFVEVATSSDCNGNTCAGGKAGLGAANANDICTCQAECIAHPEATAFQVG